MTDDPPPPPRPPLRPATAAEIPDPFAGELTFAGTTRAMVDDPTEQLLARTWRPTVSYVGADGWPPTNRAGNVLRPFTSLALSVRLPPTCDHVAAQVAIETALTTDPPYGATVTLADGHAAPGWNAPAFAPWLRAALDEARLAALLDKPAFGPWVAARGSDAARAEFARRVSAVEGDLTGLDLDDAAIAPEADALHMHDLLVPAAVVVHER